MGKTHESEKFPGLDHFYRSAHSSMHTVDNHPHITSSLVHAYVSLALLPQMWEGLSSFTQPSVVTVPVERFARLIWTNKQLTKMCMFTEFGHPDCAICHERLQDAFPLAVHEARCFAERQAWMYTNNLVKDHYESFGVPPLRS